MRMGQVRNLIPLAEPQACKKGRSPLWHAKLSSCTTSNEVHPSTGTIDQTTHVPEPRVGVTDVQLVVTKLMGKMTRQIRLQMAHFLTSIHQVGRPDTDQALEGT